MYPGQLIQLFLSIVLAVILSALCQAQQQGFVSFVVNGRTASSPQQFFNGQQNSIQRFHQFPPNTGPAQHQQVFQVEPPPPAPDPVNNNIQRQGRTQKRFLSDTCLACICKGSTECNMTTGCISNNEYCGPFLISKPYWTDADRPVIVGDDPNRDGAFIDCATDPICSAQTVRNYMLRFEQDCNGDGATDCDDLARIHLMSAFDCTNPRVPTTGFYQKFRQCWDRVLQLSQ